MLPDRRREVWLVAEKSLTWNNARWTLSGRYGNGNGSLPREPFPSRTGNNQADGTAIAESRTILAQDLYNSDQIASDELGLPTERITSSLGIQIPKAFVSGGSRLRCLWAVLFKVLQGLQGQTDIWRVAILVHRFMECRDQIMAREGRLFSRNDASKGEPFGAIIARASLKEIEVLMTRSLMTNKKPTLRMHSCSVRTGSCRSGYGEVRVTAYTGVFDMVEF